jgi:hypothetical protein
MCVLGREGAFDLRTIFHDICTEKIFENTGPYIENSMQCLDAIFQHINFLNQKHRGNMQSDLT